MNFLISPALHKKPILPKNDPGRSQAKGFFVDPDPDFVLGSVGPDHTLIFNKFCPMRPMFLLHTKQFQLQTDELNESDLAAVWSLLTAFKSPQVAIYNCGVEAGASQGHKHIQMFPARGPDEHTMFPDSTELSFGKKMYANSSDDPNWHSLSDEVQSDRKLPFQNFAIGLESDIGTNQLLSKYELLLAAKKKALQQARYNGADHNVILVRKWMVIIPRTHANFKGKASANSAGMMGMAWVKDDDEVAHWTDLGIAKHLTYLGVAS
jgi:ATP adenylyltransferase